MMFRIQWQAVYIAPRQQLAVILAPLHAVTGGAQTLEIIPVVKFLIVPVVRFDVIHGISRGVPVHPLT